MLNIYYRPTKINRYSVPEDAPSRFIKALGGLPCKLNESDLAVLRGMARTAWNDGESFQALIEAIEQYGEIEVFAE